MSTLPTLRHMRPLFLIAATALTATVQLHAELDQNDPAAELKGMQLAPGFQAELFASEKEGIIKPIQMRWDSRGRLWVIGSSTYPQLTPGEKPDDKVWILEDPERTGHVTRTTEFAGGLMIPTGLEVDGDGRGCWVGEGTKLWHFRDDGDTGHATSREIVLQGFGTGDNHQNINSFLWTPWGNLVFSQGLHSFSRVETPHGVAALAQAGLWQLNLRELHLTGYWGTYAEPQNPWGWVFTNFGQPLVTAGNMGAVCYPVPEMIAGHDARRVGNIWVNSMNRKTSNPDFVGTAHLPPEWQGALLEGGYINNAVWALKVEPDGAGYRVTDLPPLITCGHGSFRPVDVKIGPDGAIYICDWYNPIIGHYQASFRDPGRDKKHGRIWRVTYKGRPLVKQGPLAEAPLGKLMECLKSPERWTRQQAKRVLASRPRGEVTAALRPWYEKLGPVSPDNIQTLIEALGVFEAAGVPEPALLQKLLQAVPPPDAESVYASARAYAAGTLQRWSGKSGVDALPALAILANDPNPQVRLCAIVAAANIAKPESLSIALSAAEHPRDRFIDSALAEAVYALKPLWLPTLNQDAPHWKATWIEALTGIDATPDTAHLVRDLLARHTLPVEAETALACTLAKNGSPEDCAWLLDASHFVREGTYAPAEHAKVLVALVSRVSAKQLQLPKESIPMIGQLVVAQQPEIRAEGFRLAGAMKAEQYHAAIAQCAASTGDLPDRDGAIDALGMYGSPADLSQLESLATASAPAIRIAAIRALTGPAIEKAAAAASDLLRKPGDGTPASELLQAFASRKDGLNLLAKAIQTSPLPPETAAALQTAMRAKGIDNPSLKSALETAAGGAKAQMKATPELVAELVKAVLEKGNAAHGDAVFHRPETGCIACHRIGTTGGNIGPSLDSIGSAQPLHFIIGAVLEPHREVKEGYEAVQVTAKDGQITQGYRWRDDADEMVLRDMMQPGEVKIRKDQIAEIKELGSLMPSGLAENLTRQDLIDLFRYLSERGKPMQNH